MKNILYISISIWMLCSFFSCESMDDTYKEFIKEGPIMYLTRLQEDSISVRNGWKRISITYPIVKDGRSTQIALAMNQTDTIRYKLTQNKKTTIFLDDVREGSMIFSTWLEDDEFNKSLTTDFTGTIYGEQYQNYLLNRPIKKKEMKNGHLIISYPMLLDSTLVASRLTWDNEEGKITKICFYNEVGKDTLYNFKGNSFTIETLHVPQKNALDSIWSKPVTHSK